jgi:DMSO/TMAO reductase YedYZ molybdopterin-dependent catalytic subunit
MIINDGFVPKRVGNPKVPPGQYVTRDFPVLSLGPTPDIDIETWKLEIVGLVGNPHTFTWQEFKALPQTEMKTDIHCVTKWSKLDTTWQGVSMDYLISLAKVSEGATHLIAHSFDGYTTNLPIEDVMGEKAMVATSFEGEMIESPHGGPARLFVPHLYLWKSAKWLSKLEFVDVDHPGFWEVRGYHNYGDPWKEQRYTDD